MQLPPQPGLWLDVGCFRALQALCRQHGHPADQVCPACQEPLTEAAALAQGEFLAGFTLPDCPDFDDWHTFERESLRRELGGVFKRLVQLLVQRQNGLHEEAISYTRRWLALDPLHEPARRQLMELYVWSGQPTAALQQYQLCVQVLKNELGILPAAETTALYEAIKANRFSVPTPITFSEQSMGERGTPGQQYQQYQQPRPETANIGGQPEHVLPAQPTLFIGRRREVAEVCRLLTQESPPVRPLTLTGPGGTGKTRLGLQVAAQLQNHFSDGVCFVPLASLRDPQLFAAAVARQLNVREGGGQPILHLLKNALHERQLLLVLDNFEQIIAAAPDVAALLEAVPQLKVVVTSRALLHLRAEYEFLVSPLSLPPPSQSGSLAALEQSEAVQLFVDRAQATSPGFILSAENAVTVAEICRRLDGLPLAIELAAARVKLLPPDMLLQRLFSRLKLLTGGAKDMPARQQTLRNAIDWSYSLLSPAEQILFSQLAVFVGGFTLDTAEAVCNTSGETDILEGITSLLNKSLLVQQDSSGRQSRFRMLETLREYALERLADSGQLETLQRQHALYFASQIEQIGDDLNFRQGHWLDWADEEYNNLQATLAWSHQQKEQAELGLSMIGVLYWFWYRRGYLSEGRAWCQRFMSLNNEDRRPANRISFLIGSGSLAMMQGDLVEAGQKLQEALTIAQALDDAKWLISVLLAQGVLASYQGNTATALRLFEETLRLGEQLNLWWFIVTSLHYLGNGAAACGDFPAGYQYLEQATHLAKANDDTWTIATVLNNLGEVARIQGDYVQAQRSYEESQALFRQTGDKPDIARSLHSLGYVALHQGDKQQAEVYFHESLGIFQELGNKRGMTECVGGLAGLLATREPAQAKRAARLLAAAEAQLHSARSSWWPADQVEFDRHLSRLLATLDPETLASTWHEGQAMSLAEAITDALS